MATEKDVQNFRRKLWHSVVIKRNEERVSRRVMSWEIVFVKFESLEES